MYDGAAWAAASASATCPAISGRGLRQRAAFQLFAYVAIDQFADNVDQPVLAAGVVWR